MFLTMIMFAALFMFGFISIAQYTDVQQRVRAWLSSKSTTQKVKPMEEPPLQQQVKVKQLDFEAVVDTESKKKDELKRVFETFDKDGDGFITRQELREAMKGVGLALDDSEVEEMVEKMDGNGDGLIDLSEFCGSFGEVGKEEDERVLREAFEVFDGNKDGVISVEELGMVLKSLGLKQGLKLQDCEDMIRKVDMDGDGTIDFSEFKKMMRAGGSLFVSS